MALTQIVNDGLGASLTATSEGGAVTTSIQQGLAKGWVYLNGSTFGIQDSFNTASATDNGPGDYTTTRTNAFVSDDYATAGIPSASGGGNPHYNFIVENQDNRLRSTTQLRTWILNAVLVTNVDAPDYSVMFTGDLA